MRKIIPLLSLFLLLLTACANEPSTSLTTPSAGSPLYASYTRNLVNPDSQKVITPCAMDQTETCLRSKMGDLAVLEDNINLCDNATAPQECRDGYLYLNAMNKKDPAYCFKLSRIDDVQACQKKLQTP